MLKEYGVKIALQFPIKEHRFLLLFFLHLTVPPFTCSLNLPSPLCFYSQSPAEHLPPLSLDKVHIPTLLSLSVLACFIHYYTFLFGSLTPSLSPPLSQATFRPPLKHLQASDAAGSPTHCIYLSFYLSIYSSLNAPLTPPSHPLTPTLRQPSDHY